MTRSARIADLKGLWRRSLIAWPDGRRDTTARVRWLQGQRAFVDLRQPASLSTPLDAGALDQLSLGDCLELATQEGFAGRLEFEQHFHWQRRIDFQPPTGAIDAGSLEWQADTLVETGRDLPYVEHWHREGGSAPVPCGAVQLLERGETTTAMLLRVGTWFMYARDRADPLSGSAGDLAAQVAAAPTIEAARALIDCEISLGTVTSAGFGITDSTLPYRLGHRLNPRIRERTVMLDDRATDGTPTTRAWDIIDFEGDVSSLTGNAPC